MSFHRVDFSEQKTNIYRIKTFNGIEYHVLAPSMYEALDKFRITHSDEIILVTVVAKVDL